MASILHPGALVERARPLYQGILVCLLIALASTFIADHYGGPTLLYALLFGMAVHFLSEQSGCRPGIEFTARTILRLGVALLGARITVDQVTALGVVPLALVIASVTLLIISGGFIARRLGLSRDLGLLTGGSVAICGASAALALSSVMPKNTESERHLILTVVGVTTLSTIAMVLYPIIATALGLSEHTAGIFLGATIHDVAQVVGAGYMISDATGDTSTIIKLLRVAMLVPVVLAFTLLYRQSRRSDGTAASRIPLLPAFLVAFIVLVAINSAGWIPSGLAQGMETASRWCLVAAIGALGVKTSVQKLAEMGWRPVALMVIETLLLLLGVLAVLHFVGIG